MYEIFEELLKRKGITAHTVSKATGITSATFSSWKKGIYTPKQEKMQKIADYLGVSVSYLMGLDENPPAPTYTPVEQAILRDLMDLSEDQKLKILDFIQFLVFQNKKTPHE